MDVYQLLVGEIGIPRREFLYELHFWEVRRIIKGYRRREFFRNQLIAIAAYNAAFCMGNPKNVQLKQMFPMLFDIEEDDIPATPMTEEEFREEQELIKNFTW